LEISSPSLEHGGDALFLGRMVWVMTEELGMPIHFGGSTTLRHRLRQCGIQADEWFWIVNAPRLGVPGQPNRRTDLPPDLAIEVDVSHSSMDRFGVYAALGIPEVWRLEGDTLLFHVLEAGGTYQIAATSCSFPRVRPAGLIRFVQQGRWPVDQNTVIRRFRKWVRRHHALS
jgi:Uma2 family endonuclease